MNQKIRHNWFSLVMILIGMFALGLSVKSLEDSQTADRHVQRVASKEASARIESECHVLQRGLDIDRKIILVATQPVDLAGLPPERLPIIQAQNDARAKARNVLLPAIPQIDCSKFVP